MLKGIRMKVREDGSMEMYPILHSKARGDVQLTKHKVVGRVAKDLVNQLLLKLSQDEG